MGEKHNEIPVEEISQMLDAIAEKIPHLIKELMSTLYSEEGGRQMGKAVASMYKELVDSGMPEDEALKMAKDYLNTIKNFVPKGFNQSRH